MNTAITIELTPEERIDLLRFRDRVLAESRIRKEIMDGNKYKGITLTDTARDAERILPILERILRFRDRQPDVVTSGGIVKPTPVLKTGPFKVGDKVVWTSQAGGHEKTKTGTVKAVVPAWEFPRVHTPDGFSLRTDSNFGLPHESYLVQVGRSKSLYWPLAKKLKSIKP